MGGRSADCRIHCVWGQVMPLERYTLLLTQNCWPRTTNMMNTKTYPSSLMDGMGLEGTFGF